MLKLSTKGRYGLRAMIELAQANGDEPMLMGEIAKRQDFSRKYLHTLLTSLKGAGLVKSVRGAKGGYLLNKPAEEIQVAQIFHALEGSSAVVNCLDDEESCRRDRAFNWRSASNVRFPHICSSTRSPQRQLLARSTRSARSVRRHAARRITDCRA